jgi:hypothetical protein
MTLSNSKSWVGIMCAAAGLQAAPVEIQLAGVDASAEPVRVSLVNPANGERDWVKLGGRFAGCEVRGYDATRQTVILTRGNESWEVALQAAVVATVTLSEEERAKIEKSVFNNLRQLSSAADQYYLEHGVSTVKIEQLVGNSPLCYIKELKPADGEDYSRLRFSQGADAEWEVVTARGVKVPYGRR